MFYHLLKQITWQLQKVIEIIATCPLSFDDAVKQGINEVSKTIRNIDSIWVRDQKAHVKDGEIISYGVNCKVSFRVIEGE